MGCSSGSVRCWPSAQCSPGPDQDLWFSPGRPLTSVSVAWRQRILFLDSTTASPRSHDSLPRHTGGNRAGLGPSHERADSAECTRSAGHCRSRFWWDLFLPVFTGTMSPSSTVRGSSPSHSHCATAVSSSPRARSALSTTMNSPPCWTNEHAHLRQRHHLISSLVDGIAVHLRWVPLVAAVAEAIPHYLEIAADNHARQAVGTPALVGALLKMATPSPDTFFDSHPAALHAAGPERIRQLVRPGAGSSGAIPLIAIMAYLLALGIASVAIQIPYASAAITGCS